jgi:hypothetical protein
MGAQNVNFQPLPSRGRVVLTREGLLRDMTSDNPGPLTPRAGPVQPMHYDGGTIPSDQCRVMAEIK